MFEGGQGCYVAYGGENGLSLFLPSVGSVGEALEPGSGGPHGALQADGVQPRGQQDFEKRQHHGGF